VRDSTEMAGFLGSPGSGAVINIGESRVGVQVISASPPDIPSAQTQVNQYEFVEVIQLSWTNLPSLTPIARLLGKIWGLRHSDGWKESLIQSDNFAITTLIWSSRPLLCTRVKIN